MVQWIGIHLPMQGTQVQSLVWKDSSCCRAVKPVGQATESTHSKVHASQQEKPQQGEAYALRLEKACA